MCGADKIAAIAGLSVRQFNRLVREGHVPKAQRALFDPEAALAALIAYYRQGKAGSSNYDSEKLRHVIAQRREVEQRTALKARELLPAQQVRTTFDTAMTLIGSQLDGLAGRIANDVAAQSDPAICRGIIFNETRRIRAAAAAELETIASTDRGRKTPPTAESDDGG
jgi:phage terminase Nu1 subunit (DNA packaging protein)